MEYIVCMWLCLMFNIYITIENYNNKNYKFSIVFAVCIGVYLGIMFCILINEIDKFLLE